MKALTVEEAMNGVDVKFVLVVAWRMCLSKRVGVRRRSFDSGEIKRAADGGASIDCCCNYSAILAQSQMKLFRTELAADANRLLPPPRRNGDILNCMLITIPTGRGFV